MYEKIIEKWSKAQKDGKDLPCPRCGRNTMKKSVFSNSLSRRANIYICPDCGTAEAIEDLGVENPHDVSYKEEKIKKWFIVKEEKLC